MHLRAVATVIGIVRRASTAIVAAAPLPEKQISIKKHKHGIVPASSQQQTSLQKKTSI